MKKTIQLPVMVWLVIMISVGTMCGQKRKKGIQQDTIPKTSFIIQPNRIEFEIDSKDGGFHIISADKRGLLVLKETKKRLEKGFAWDLFFVDSLLNMSWTSTIEVAYGAIFLGYDHTGDSFYILFSTSLYKLKEMCVFEIDTATGSSQLHDVKLPVPLALSHFEVIGRSLIFGGYLSFRPVISIYDLNRKIPKVLPGFYNHNSSIIAIRTDDQTNNFTVVSIDQIQNKMVTIAIKTFTEYGALVHVKVLNTEFEKNLIDGVSTSFDNGTQYVVGTYSKRTSEYSQGLYLTKLEMGEQQYINYYDYGELKNFFSYMRVNREARVKERIERKKVKGKKARFSYRLLVHDIIQHKDEYIMIGEAYYPKYAHQGNSGLYTSTATQSFSDPTFIGYNYTHAVVVGFSKSGKILWDNSFEINDLISRSLEKNVQINVEDDRIVLLYVYDNVIRSKIIQNNEIIEGKSLVPVALHFKSDEIEYHDKEKERLKKWFHGNFYTYGVQHIKNLRDQNVKLHRKVFYINKVQYQ